MGTRGSEGYTVDAIHKTGEKQGEREEKCKTQKPQGDDPGGKLGLRKRVGDRPRKCAMLSSIDNKSL